MDARVALLEVTYVAAVLHIGRTTGGPRGDTPRAAIQRPCCPTARGSRNGSVLASSWHWMKSTWKLCFSEGSNVEKLSEVFAGQISGVFLSRVEGTLQGQTGGRCHRPDQRVEIVPLGAHDDSEQAAQVPLAGTSWQQELTLSRVGDGENFWKKHCATHSYLPVTH